MLCHNYFFIVNMYKLNNSVYINEFQDKFNNFVIDIEYY